jgi:hypothetical protein
MNGFGRTIALWGFIAVQQFLADIDDDFSWRVATAAVTMMRTSQLSCKIVLRFELPAKRV